MRLTLLIFFDELEILNEIINIVANNANLTPIKSKNLNHDLETGFLR